MRDPILAAAIRFLLTGVNYSELQQMLQTHQNTISKYITEVCETISTRLKDTYLKENSQVFENFWQLKTLST